MTLKTAVLAPIPSASVTTATAVTPGRWRKIATVWRTRGESYLVDESGLILVRGAIVGQSVLIDDQGNVARQPGDHVPMDALSLVWGLNRIEPDLDTFQYSELRGVTIVTPQGYPVYFGTKGDAAFKLGLLRVLTSDLRARGIRPQYVDLRLDQRPAYR